MIWMPWKRFLTEWRNLGQIYESGELTKEATVRKIGIVQSEGDREVERTPLLIRLLRRLSMNVLIPGNLIWD